MRRIKLVVAYDGTRYCGWQLQPNGVTIEEVLNQALSELLKETIAVVGASRTDSGVHSRGNIAVFDTESRIPAEKICFAVNQRLPEDVRVQSSEEVAADWHPRKQNCVKTYEYRILNRKIDMPVGRLYTHFCYFDLNVDSMQRAASYLVGEHDFKSFCTVRNPLEDTVRKIYSLTVEKDKEDVIHIRVSGNGFLYNMVRIIAGTLIRIGMGAYPPEHIREILAARDRQEAGDTAPARGLTLISMEYEKELPPEISIENEDWSYQIVQREIGPKGKAYIVIRRCREDDWDSLIARLIHQCRRNGAREIFVSDRQAGRSRLASGSKYGYYTLEPAFFCWSMEKKIDCGFLSEGSASGGVPDSRPKAEAVKLTPLRKRDMGAWLEIYKEIFCDLSGSATYDKEMVETEKGEGSRFFWVSSKGRRCGFAVLKELTEEKTLFIDMVGIRSSYRRRGLGKALLREIENRAAKAGLEKLKLIAANTNVPALSLYKAAGFVKSGRNPWFYLAKDEKNGLT